LRYSAPGTLREDPVEYAMLQSTLRNALQAVDTSQRFENLARAVQTCDDTPKVTTGRDMPVGHANTPTHEAAYR